MLTANRLVDGDVLYWADGGWVLSLKDGQVFADPKDAEAALAAAQRGREGQRSGGDLSVRRKAGRRRHQAGEGTRDHPRRRADGAPRPRQAGDTCIGMTSSMRGSCGAGGAVSRPGGAAAVGRTERGPVQAAQADERALSAAARLHAAHRGALRHAERAADADAGAYRADIRQGLRPFHHAAEHPVQLAQAGRRARHPGRSRDGGDARDPDQRQLHPQRHGGPFRGRRGRRDRGSAAAGRDRPAMVEPASRIRLPAAQVQDRGERQPARPRRAQIPRHGDRDHMQRCRRDRLPRAGGRRYGAHAPMSASSSANSSKSPTSSPSSKA